MKRHYQDLGSASDWSIEPSRNVNIMKKVFFGALFSDVISKEKPVVAHGKMSDVFSG